jgi:hypothetical protein
MIARARWTDIAVFAVAMLIGVSFGDRLFPEVEAILGDPAADILLGLVAAFFATLAFEIVAMFRRLD